MDELSWCSSPCYDHFVRHFRQSLLRSLRQWTQVAVVRWTCLTPSCQMSPERYWRGRDPGEGGGGGWWWWRKCTWQRNSNSVVSQRFQRLVHCGGTTITIRRCPRTTTFEEKWRAKPELNRGRLHWSWTPFRWARVPRKRAMPERSVAGWGVMMCGLMSSAVGLTLGTTCGVWAAPWACQQDGQICKSVNTVHNVHRNRKAY